MTKDPLLSSPFYRQMPVGWRPYQGGPIAYSLTRSHGLKTRLHFHNLTSPINQDRVGGDKILITYEVTGRQYEIFTLGDMHRATYSFDEIGFSNMKGDLAERLARRLMKRFLQRFDQQQGKQGGLFDKRFDPKKRENYVVANTRDYVLKIGRYPNMILLKKTGLGAWGYQHITDLDGLFDYRYLFKRHLIIMESKIGKIDINAEALYGTLFVPLKKLFPDATFAYALFAMRDNLLEGKDPEYRILQDSPRKIFKALLRHKIPCFFFEFNEGDSDFQAMCRHLVTTYRTYHRQGVHFQGKVSISDNEVIIFNPGSHSPYLELKKDPLTGQFQVIRTARRIPDSTSLPESTD